MPEKMVEEEIRPQPFGKYLLLDRINVGGMAEVFRAKSKGMAGIARLVAIKRILPYLAKDPEFTEMFIDEARIAIHLRHANIAQIYELDKVGDSLFIAMEYVHGQDLRALINRMRKLKRKIPLGIISYIISSVCEALDYAHRKKDELTLRELNIVHRDVSPQNVILSYEGEVKLIDFGIAKAAAKQNKTKAGILKGKFGYMAPEQVMGREIDRRADIFCTGIIFYELLTRDRLFAGSNEISTLRRIRQVELAPPTLLDREIPKEFENIILKALSLDPDDRYQYASDMAEDLLKASQALGIKPFTSKQLREFMREVFAEDFERDLKKLEKIIAFIREEDEKTRLEVASVPNLQIDSGGGNTPPSGHPEIGGKSPEKYLPDLVPDRAGSTGSSAGSLPLAAEVSPSDTAPDSPPDTPETGGGTQEGDAPLLEEYQLHSLPVVSDSGNHYPSVGPNNSATSGTFGQTDSSGMGNFPAQTPSPSGFSGGTEGFVGPGSSPSIQPGAPEKKTPTVVRGTGRSKVKFDLNDFYGDKTPRQLQSVSPEGYSPLGEPLGIDRKKASGKKKRGKGRSVWFSIAIGLGGGLAGILLFGIVYLLFFVPAPVKPILKQSIFQSDSSIQLLITSSPPGVEIFIDGQKRGTTPLELNLSLRRYTIRAEKSGYIPKTFILDLSNRSRGKYKINIELKPKKRE